MRPSSSPFANPSGLVDRRLGHMWAQVEEVRTYLPQIAHVSYYLESLFNLDRNLTLLSDENVDHHILKDITIFQGANTYEIALSEGFVGTPTEWLTSLIGPQGDPGVVDTTTLNTITSGIATNASDISDLQTTTSNLATSLASYVPLSTYNARVAVVDAALAGIEDIITTVVGPLLPTVRTDEEITTLAQGLIDTAVATINSSLSDVGDLIDGIDTSILDLENGLADAELAFSDFLIANDTTLTRITSLEASKDSQSASITELQSVSTANALLYTSLQAESDTHAANITDIQTVNASAAVQINALQVANNANFAAIESIEIAYVTADEALATAIDTLETEYIAADGVVASTAAALVSAETSARTTALSAAASDRTAIRSEFATADSGVLSSATALVTSEASTRSTADSAAATDRTAIRSEFASADAGLQTDINTRATITQLATAESDAASARAALSASLTAAYEAADAAISAEVSTTASALATETSARVTQGSTITASVSTERLSKMPKGFGTYPADYCDPGADGDPSTVASTAAHFTLNANGLLTKTVTTPGGYWPIQPKAWLPLSVGKKFRLRVTWRFSEVPDEGAGYTAGALWFRRYDAAGNYQDAPVFTTHLNDDTTSWRTEEIEWTSNYSSGWLRGGFYTYNTITGYMIEVGELEFIEVDTPLAASVSVLEEAFIDTTTGLAFAKFELIATASGGRPARFGLYSDSEGSSNVALDAQEIFFGDNTIWEDTYNTFYTEASSKRLRSTGVFPAAQDLVMWFGPTSVALNSETKTNGFFALGTDGKVYYGGAELNGGETTPIPAEPSVSNPFPSGTASPGFVASAGCTASPGDWGTGPYTYFWEKLTGTAGITISSTTTASPTFSITISAYPEFNSASYRCTITDNTGAVRQVGCGPILNGAPP